MDTLEVIKLKRLIKLATALGFDDDVEHWTKQLKELEETTDV